MCVCVVQASASATRRRRRSGHASLATGTWLSASTTTVRVTWCVVGWHLLGIGCYVGVCICVVAFVWVPALALVPGDLALSAYFRTSLQATFFYPVHRECTPGGARVVYVSVSRVQIACRFVCGDVNVWVGPPCRNR